WLDETSAAVAYRSAPPKRRTGRSPSDAARASAGATSAPSVSVAPRRRRTRSWWDIGLRRGSSGKGGWGSGMGCGAGRGVAAHSRGAVGGSGSDERPEHGSRKSPATGAAQRRGAVVTTAPPTDEPVRCEPQARARTLSKQFEQ